MTVVEMQHLRHSVSSSNACTQATAPVISTGAKRSGEISLRNGTPPWRQEISRLRVSIELKTFTLIPTCRPARNDSRGGCTCAILFLPQMPVHSPPPLSFRPEPVSRQFDRSEVEKSRSEMVQPPWRQEISRLRVLIEDKTFTLIPTCSPARNDSRGGCTFNI